MADCTHEWIYRNGRSFCADCGAWAPDLRCFPQLRQNGGHYPTAPDVQNHYACQQCYANFRARVVGGKLRVLCDCGHDLASVQVIPKQLRDYILARQEAEAVEVLDGLPAELRAMLER